VQAPAVADPRTPLDCSGPARSRTRPSPPAHVLVRVSARRAGFIESGGIYDPLNYAAGKDINRLRSVELKNGRICMLATHGYVVQETYSWPNTQGYFDGSNPITTFATVPAFGVLQIIAVIALIETRTGNEWQRGEPGDIGFDPLGLAKDGINPAYADAELKHARLAMVGWLGFVLQSLVTGKGVLATTFEAFN
jgi:hypothetical protein